MSRYNTTLLIDWMEENWEHFETKKKLTAGILGLTRRSGRWAARWRWGGIVLRSGGAWRRSASLIRGRIAGRRRPGSGRRTRLKRLGSRKSGGRTRSEGASTPREPLRLRTGRRTLPGCGRVLQDCWQISGNGTATALAYKHRITNVHFTSRSNCLYLILVR